MKSLSAAALFTLGLGVAAPSFAQQTQTDTWRMPYERGFWGHAGVSAGPSRLDADCPSGTSCDDKDYMFRAYAGGRFNNAIGLELGVLNFGKYQRGGGDTDGWGADIALIAGIPIGANSSIFGKLGAVYARTEADGIGIETGKERGFGPRFGIGGQVGLTKEWAIRADLDRYHVPLPGGKENLDTFMLGVQYTFR